MSDDYLQAEIDKKKELVFLKRDNHYITSLHPDQFSDLFPGWSRELERCGEIQIPFQDGPKYSLKVQGVGA